MNQFIFLGYKFPDNAIVRRYETAHFITIAGSSFSCIETDESFKYRRFEYFSNTAIAGAIPVSGLFEFRTSYAYQLCYAVDKHREDFSYADYISIAKELLPIHRNLFSTLLSESGLPEKTVGTIVTCLTEKLLFQAANDRVAALTQSIQSACKYLDAVVTSQEYDTEDGKAFARTCTSELANIAKFARAIRQAEINTHSALLSSAISDTK